MALSDTTFQIPTFDDIDQDSLEYLFGRRKSAAPWVRMAKELEPVARISPEMVRLQAKLETFAAQMEMMLRQLNKTHVELGFARAQLAHKDQQLSLLAEYRARAAFVVAAETERTILNERIADLEMQLVEALESKEEAQRALMPSALRITDAWQSGQSKPALPVVDAILKHGQQKPYAMHISMLSVIYGLIIGFASLMLLNILIYV